MSETVDSKRDADSNEDALLSVRGLKKHYPIRKGLLRREVGRVRAVDGIDFDLRRGEALGVVGESGCGKSTAARAVLSLETPTAGTVTFDGQDVTELSKSERKRFRRRVQMVFQDPTSSFDPRMTIGESVAEPMVAHGLADDERRSARVASLLEIVGLSADDGDRYPHELSGGQKQRAALARALSLNPEVLVLDEPVSALDVSVQAEILALVGDLREAFDLAILLISHDMNVVRQLCDRVAVMYLGEVVERAPTEGLFEDPKHPYTRGLLHAIPEPDPHARTEEVDLSGDVPDPAAPPSGCRFHTRCPAVIPPDDLGVSQSVWRSMFAFRVTLQNGDFGLESIRERVAEESVTGRAGEESETVRMADGPGTEQSQSELRERIRETYDLPAELADEDAERSLSKAVGAAATGDVELAAETLREAFPTVCTRERPDEYGPGGRTVACHLYRSSDVTDETDKTDESQ